MSPAAEAPFLVVSLVSFLPCVGHCSLIELVPPPSWLSELCIPYICKNPIVSEVQGWGVAPHLPPPCLGSYFPAQGQSRVCLFNCVEGRGKQSFEGEKKARLYGSEKYFIGLELKVSTEVGWQVSPQDKATCPKTVLIAANTVFEGTLASSTCLGMKYWP